MFQAAGRDFDKLKQAATRRDFKPEVLGGTARFGVTNALREVKSRNVIARIEGTDPSHKNETVIYTAQDYHKVSDQVKPDWDLAGAVEDLKLLVELGYRVTQADRYPEWKPDSEFRAKREAMLKGAKP